MIDRELIKGTNDGSVPCCTGDSSSIVARSWVSVRVKGGGKASLAFQKSAAPENADGWPPGTRTIWDFDLHNGRREFVEIPSGTEFIDYVIEANGAGFLCVEMQAK